MSNDTDKSATMKQYFACMDSADFVTAAAMFADDAVYLRPPYVPGQAAFATSGTAKTYGHGIVRLEGQIAALTADAFK